MTRAISAAAMLLLAACASEPVETVASKPKIIQPECTTVVPYTPLKMRKPKNDVPEAWRAFAGFWGGGAWDGAVCHDLWVMNVEDDGTVEIFDAHGPGFGYDATGFARKGKINGDGRMTVRKGAATVEYWIENGQLHGVRRQGKVRSRIILLRKS